MMYMRGHRNDYDTWAKMGLTGWSYDDVLPIFRSFEQNLSHLGDDSFHGRTGEVVVKQAGGENPLYKAYIEAAGQAGFAICPDFNGSEQEGFGLYDFNIRQGRRVSSASAFLRPVIGRPNLEVFTRTQVTRLLFDGRHCRGVECIRDGKRVVIKANREVILCGGVYNSPQILQLSGVGDANFLRSKGIEMVADLPHVGQHLQDHLGLFLEWRCLKPITLYSLYRPDRAIAAVLRAKLFGTGPGAVIPLEAGGFVRSRAELNVPDLQITFVPGLSLATNRRGQREHGFIVSVALLRPEVEGKVTIRSAAPLDKPVIEIDYMSRKADIQVLREGARIARDIISQRAFDPYRGAELAPGAETTSDTALDEWVQNTGGSAWHGTGTCRMGSGDDSVVDGELKVRGVAGLRVADASIMPTSIGGNTSIPTMMIAAKASQMILGERYKSTEFDHGNQRQSSLV
jgi:choline dehydrogenase